MDQGIGGLGEGLQAYYQAKRQAQQDNVSNQTAQAGLLNAGYQVGPDGNLVQTDLGKQKTDLEKQNLQVQKDAMTPGTAISQQKVQFGKQFLKSVQPGAENMITDDMSGAQVDNIISQAKALQESQLNTQQKKLDMDVKRKELAKPDEAAAGASVAYNQAKSAHEAVKNLEASGFDPSSAGAGMQGLLGTKWAQTPQFKQNQAAENQFIGAYQAWRKQRGENPEAAEVLKARFFAQPGEDQGTKSLKEQSREDFVNDLGKQAGGYGQGPRPKKGLLASKEGGGKSGGFSPDVVSYAQAHGISPQAAQMIKMARTASQTAGR